MNAWMNECLLMDTDIFIHIQYIYDLYIHAWIKTLSLINKDNVSWLYFPKVPLMADFTYLQELNEKSGAPKIKIKYIKLGIKPSI